jgi:hypothetical protein
VTDRAAGNEHTNEDALLDELLARTEEGVLGALSFSVDVDTGLAEIFSQHPRRRPPRRRTSQGSSEGSQATRRP